MGTDGSPAFYSGTTDTNLNADGMLPVLSEVQNSTAREYASKSAHCCSREPGMRSLPVAFRASNFSRRRRTSAEVTGSSSVKETGPGAPCGVQSCSGWLGSVTMEWNVSATSLMLQLGSWRRRERPVTAFRMAQDFLGLATFSSH